MCLFELRNKALKFVKVAPKRFRGKFSAFKTLDEIRTEINSIEIYGNPLKRRLLIDQIIAFLHGSYVFSDTKTDSSELDPVLKLLAFGNEIQKKQVLNLDYFGKLIRIIDQFDDLHTYLELPNEISQYIGFVPFLIEPYYDHKTENLKYIISHFATGFTSDEISKGDEVVRWQGLPIEKAIERAARGSRFRSITQSYNRKSDALTLISLKHSLPSRHFDVLRLDIRKDGESEPTPYWHMFLYAKLGITPMYSNEAEKSDTTIKIESTQLVHQSVEPFLHQLSMAKSILFRKNTKEQAK